MRLNNYLLEDVSFDIIKKQCSDIINIYKETGKFLYRGIKKTQPIKLIKPREDRRPLSSAPELHNLLDEYFLKNFGWKARSEGVFVTSNWGNALYYSNLIYVFFPVNDFKYIWSPRIADLFVTLQSEGLSEPYPDASNPNVRSFSNSRMDEIKKILNSYQDTNLVRGLIKGYEIMFKCKGYYLINVEKMMKNNNWLDMINL